MFQVELTPDETQGSVKWLRVSHNGKSWSSISVRNANEAYAIVDEIKRVLGTIEPCELCHGFAVIFRDKLQGEADEDTIDCPECRGSGKAW